MTVYELLKLTDEQIDSYKPNKRCTGILDAIYRR